MRAGRCAAASLIDTPDPYLNFARLTQWWSVRSRPIGSSGIHPSAVVAADAVLGVDVQIGAHAVIETGAVLGDGVRIGTQCHVGAGVVVGAHTRLAPQVVLMHGTTVGERCLLHSGVVVGADGFGFAPHQGEWIKIEQLGGVVIGDDVEIGANTTIDRGAIDDTIIETGVKLDNQIQIAHNVRIGAHTAIAGCVGIAGSTRIGRRCTVGGAAMIIGHLTIADDVSISSGTLVTKSIAQAGIYTGSVPFLEHGQWLRNFSRLRHLDAMADRIRVLEARLADLEKKT